MFCFDYQYTFCIAHRIEYYIETQDRTKTYIKKSQTHENKVIKILMQRCWMCDWVYRSNSVQYYICSFCWMTWLWALLKCSAHFKHLRNELPHKITVSLKLFKQFPLVGITQQSLSLEILLFCGPFDVERR